MNENPAVWSTLAPTEFGFLNDLSEVVAKWEAENRGFLTPLGEGPILVLASDYGGQESTSRFETFSFLVADWIHLWLWEEMRKEVRRTLLPDRTISYKRLNDRKRRRALAPFLRAANVIPGLLFTVAINKEIRSRIIHAESETVVSGRIWKASSAEKLGLISGIATVLVAGLSDHKSPGQHILWMTDQDEILPDKQRSRDSLSVLANFMQRWIPQDIGDVIWSVSSGKEADYQNEDLLSLADLACGCLADFLTCSSFVYHDRVESLEAESFEAEHTIVSALKEKTEVILDWYEEDQHPLKRLAVVVDKSANSSYRLWVLKFPSVPDINPEFDWREEALSRIAMHNLAWERSALGQKFDQKTTREQARLLLDALRRSEIKLGEPESTIRFPRKGSSEKAGKE